MKLKHKIIATVVGIAAVSSAVLLKPQHIGPTYLYPDPALTPGKIDTSDFAKLTQRYNGKTYSQNFRNVPDSEKQIVCNESPAYKLNCSKPNEKDHLCPIALGCSNDKENIWPQLEHALWNGQDFGFHTKDRLEAFLVAQMKAQKISPTDAQQCILQDWVACYQKYLGKPQLGGANFTDPDNI